MGVITLTVVNDEDDSGAAALTTEAEGVLVALHGIDCAHQRRVVSVQCGDQVADSHDGVQLQHAF